VPTEVQAPPRRRSWIGFPARMIRAYFRPAGQAFDLAGIRRTWRWAEQGRQRLSNPRQAGLPVTYDAHGAVDLEASAAQIREDAAAEYWSRRCSHAEFQLTGSITADQFGQLIARQRRKGKQRIRLALVSACLAVVVSLYCLLFVRRTSSAVGSGVFFLLLSVYCALWCLAETKEQNKIS
jgi:hypothetical protein